MLLSNPIRVEALTAWVDARHAHVKTAEFGSQQPDQVVGGRFARRVAGQVHIGSVVHASAGARDDDDAAAVILALAAAS